MLIHICLTERENSTIIENRSEILWDMILWKFQNIFRLLSSPEDEKEMLQSCIDFPATRQNGTKNRVDCLSDVFAKRHTVVLILSENKFYYHELMLLFPRLCGDLFTSHLTLFEVLGFQQQNYYFSYRENLKLLSHQIRSSDNRLDSNSAKQSRKSSNIRRSFISNQD